MLAMVADLLQQWHCRRVGFRTVSSCSCNMLHGDAGASCATHLLSTGFARLQLLVRFEGFAKSLCIRVEAIDAGRPVEQPSKRPNGRGVQLINTPQDCMLCTVSDALASKQWSAQT